MTTKRARNLYATIPAAVARAVQSGCQRGLATLLQAVAIFAQCKRGGAMLLAGFLSMTLMTSLGAMMTNYAWREAQQEELQSAMRASIASAAPLLARVTDPDAQEDLKQRVAGVLSGLMAGIRVSKDDVTVSHDTSTNITRVSVGGSATYKFKKLWGDEDEGDVQLPLQTVAVVLEFDRYETVVAADMSSSMNSRMTGDTSATSTRIAALKRSFNVAINAMEEASAANTGSLTIGLVPFSHAVNVADTSGSGQTAAKQRYAYMLGGAAHDDTNAADSAHWVDVFHHYGSSGTWGSDLQTRTLPIFASTTSWDLRGNVNVDLADEAPNVGTWSVRGRDFWNGCVMARWGAYWDANARPAACVAGCQPQCADGDTTCTPCAAGCWDADMSQNLSQWPATLDVDPWTPASNALTAEPLHLSDAPPDATDANTRFTAYSWPDARVGTYADGNMLGVLLETLEPNILPDAELYYVQDVVNATDNNWSLSASDPSGDWGCSTNAIVPLTEDATALRAASSALGTINRRVNHGTFTHLGVVWGLRVLSPLWTDVWATQDDAGIARPLTPCADEETGTHCTSHAKKLILYITDGWNAAPNTSPSIGGGVIKGRIHFDKSSLNLVPPGGINFQASDTGKLCDKLVEKSNGPFANSINDTSPSDFNARFEHLGADGGFAGTSLDRLVAAFERIKAITLPAAGQNLLRGKTPWEMFRNYGFLNDGTSLTDALMTTGNGFDFAGRPTFDDMACRLTSGFTAYGRLDDLMQAGGKPVAGVAPFANITGSSKAALQAAMKTRLDNWLYEACRIAKARNVQIKAIYLGGTTTADDTNALETLRQCIDAAGGNRNTDVYNAPTSDRLASIFRNIFTVNRNLRFLN